MTTAAAQQTLERTDTGQELGVVPGTYNAVPGPESPGRVASWRTPAARKPKRPVPPVPCTECGTEHPPNKSGLCVKCWRLSDGPRNNATAKQGEGDPRKRDPDWQWKNMLAPLARSAFRRAEGEDVESGLAYALEFAEYVNAAVKALGEAKVAELGPSLVAAGLGWDKRRAWKRWGAGDEPEEEA